MDMYQCVVVLRHVSRLRSHWQQLGRNWKQEIRLQRWSQVVRKTFHTKPNEIVPEICTDDYDSTYAAASRGLQLWRHDTAAHFKIVLDEL
jgi:hypothetical protein